MADGESRPMSPRARYQADLAHDDFHPDATQARVVDALESTYQALTAKPTHIGHLFGRGRRAPVKGLYLWGGVGRGKTYLMDCFFDSLPFEDKTRLHFHRFMQKVHETRRHYAHRADPLKLVAQEWAADRVLCFDEFYVSDVADAMILAWLAEGLFERGVTLVATSNVAPDDLYRNGLQRDRFLPTIEDIKTHCQVMHIDDGTDYRLHHIEQEATYQTPNNTEAEARLSRHFQRLATGRVVEDGNVKILGRKIAVRRRAESIVWFDFADLCGSYRSSNDYIQLAREFRSVMISNVPVLHDRNDDAARRFINAIDEFYDRRVNLFITAEASPEELYDGSRLIFEFQRTASRLHEMGSRVYLATPHRH